MCEQVPWFLSYAKLVEKAGADHYASERLNEALTFVRVTGRNYSLEWIDEILNNLPLSIHQEFSSRVRQSVVALLEDMYIEQYGKEYNAKKDEEDMETFKQLAE
jgi:hypothetical protein